MGGRGISWSDNLAVVAAVLVLGLLAILPMLGTSAYDRAGAAVPQSASTTDCEPTSGPTVSVDGKLDTLFSHEFGPGWVGGDATYSTALPHGDEAFDFSDTLIGTADQKGRATFTGMVHNSELAGTMPDLQSMYGGTYGAPQTLIPDTAGDGAMWWVAATFSENGSQLIFVNEFEPVSGSAYEEYTGRSAIAVMSLSTPGSPQFSSLTLLPTDAGTQWGNSLTQAGGFTYVYGFNFSQLTGKFAGLKLARVAEGDALVMGDWQYWNGAQWVSGEEQATPIPATGLFTGVAGQPGGGYIAVSIDDGPQSSLTLDTSYACALTGPWSSPEAVYAIPQISQYPGETAYIPTVHPELSSAGHLVVSYNVNTIKSWQALEQNVHKFQPRFVELSD